ncbi:MAG: cobyrinate a,c-diamide synthase [Rhizobiaceae bacterium]|nr:cobyrinate a,c-diamide synthase [Rhizobiaceae bacterium]
MTARGLIIGAPRSGSGKTSVTIGLLRALARRGIKAGGAKSGPDYIDPEFHAAATGNAGVNLDSWAMAPDLLGFLAAEAARNCDILIAESAMGLFDGIEAGRGRSGAASDLAARFSLPTVLVLDISGQSRSAAAVAKGFAVYDPEVRVAGVVLNKVASERHLRQCADAIEAAGLPVFGAIMRNPDMALPERHLGLVQAREHTALDAFIDRLADVMEQSLDIDRMLAAAVPLDGLPTIENPSEAIDPPGQRIALAHDEAFGFLYPHLQSIWRKRGAEIHFFSPLADEAPAPDCDVCWLPGGYPELHGARLADARNFRRGTTRFAQTKPVHGECGGYMTLGASIEDAEGHSYEMLGLLGHSTSFAKRKMNLGYRQAKLLSSGILGGAGETIRGHEFHYASVTEAGQDTPFFEMSDGLGRPLGPGGGIRGNVTGGFFHAIARS